MTTGASLAVVSSTMGMPTSGIGFSKDSGSVSPAGTAVGVHLLTPSVVLSPV